MTLSLTDRKEIQKFGVTAFLFFGLFCIIAAWQQKVLIAYFFGSLSLMGMGFFMSPVILKPIYDKWLLIAHFIGRAITVIMLTIAYFLVITPFALIKRFFGGTPISLKTDKKISSYWVVRSELAQPKERFLKRF